MDKNDKNSKLPRNFKDIVLFVLIYLGPLIAVVMTVVYYDLDLERIPLYVGLPVVIYAYVNYKYIIHKIR